MKTRDKTCHMTAGAKKYLLNHSKEIQNALNRFISGDFGDTTDRPSNDLIRDFGSYQLAFGTLWIISYNIFTNRDFITLLLPCEFDGPKYQKSQPL